MVVGDVRMDGRFINKPPQRIFRDSYGIGLGLIHVVDYSDRWRIRIGKFAAVAAFCLQFFVSVVVYRMSFRANGLEIGHHPCRSIIFRGATRR